MRTTEHASRAHLRSRSLQRGGSTPPTGAPRATPATCGNRKPTAKVSTKLIRTGADRTGPVDRPGGAEDVQATGREGLRAPDLRQPGAGEALLSFVPGGSKLGRRCVCCTGSGGSSKNLPKRNT